MGFPLFARHWKSLGADRKSYHTILAFLKRALAVPDLNLEVRTVRPSKAYRLQQRLIRRYLGILTSMTT
ncbi:hypothetical protein HRR83_002441 [Exophiala dermatitidis]|uniref:Uncharacterized protein n=1 Tax=Exophiala dermatitidis TaxID=5970 RepID=A0AAN6EYZ6_EXODE|nr:hypothetical protein HRR73_002136 [Exophiala dermatitidis]KAJ4536722.1 hypothetical protein HRR76_004748 [Exophiala dermatitidis]KAJ4555675.1 hypothetical protein HRR77_001605 [Exophiala dermatitidis]KAJ4556187.1 hypothetical protein HRR78_001845 [Exophiala dermatitidis]KAJ4568978.1 hypothetical protein HRR81_006636 [Exophiala dermatitidis]